MATRSSTLAALVILAGAAAAISARGLSALAPTAAGLHPIVLLALTAAIHTAWIGALAGRGAWLIPAIAWPISLRIATAGLQDVGWSSPGLTAFFLELLLAAIAVSLAPPQSVADRLAGWRRARTAIATQLHMGQGLIPWLRDIAEHALVGRGELPGDRALSRFVAQLADAECHLRVRLSQAGLPAHLPEAVLTRAQSLLSAAEIVTAESTAALERQALEAAVGLRDLCHALPDRSTGERDEMATQCERLLLDLVSLDRRTSLS